MCYSSTRESPSLLCPADPETALPRVRASCAFVWDPETVWHVPSGRSCPDRAARVTRGAKAGGCVGPLRAWAVVEEGPESNFGLRCSTGF